MARGWQRQGTWLPMVQLTTFLGLVFAVEHWGLALMVALTFMIALFAWGVLATMWGDAGLAAVPRILRRGVEVGLITTALAGLATALGIVSLLVAGALVVSHPQVRAKAGALWATRVTPPAGQAPKGKNHRDLSDADLCKAWQRSCATLRSAKTPTDKAAIVQLRQDYLDELQRRYPDGLASWLASGAPADANPQRYLARGDSREPGAA